MEDRWLKRILNRCYILAVLITTCHICTANALHGKEKRQIFREEVLPSAGGKIPDFAFFTDRLNLNRLNKDGFSFPDGILIDHRRQLKHPFPYQNLPEVLRVHLTDDGRFVAVHGKYLRKIPDAIETTYIIRSPISMRIKNVNFLIRRLGLTGRSYKPTLVPFYIPNNVLFKTPSIKPFVREPRSGFNNIIHDQKKMQDYDLITKGLDNIDGKNYLTDMIIIEITWRSESMKEDNNKWCPKTNWINSIIDLND